MLKTNIYEKQVTPDAVYTELYTEMRRFRDYEVNISTWYTTILAAVLGGLLLILTGNNKEIYSFFTEYIYLKCIIAFFTICITFCSIFSVRYVSARYKVLRDYVKNNLEPDDSLEIESKGSIKPVHGLIFTQILLCFMILVLLGSPYKWYYQNYLILTEAILILYLCLSIFRKRFLNILTKICTLFFDPK